MLAMTRNAMPSFRTAIHWFFIALLALSLAPVTEAKKKKKAEAPQSPQEVAPVIDTSKLVWPQPPDIARIRWLSELRGEQPPPLETKSKKKKQGWMDRLAGVQQQDFTRPALVHILAKPYGVVEDSKGLVYVGDTYVGAVFIINLETQKMEFIRNGAEAKFKNIIGLAMDDSDRLFVVDAALHQVSVFNPNHKLEMVFGTDDLARPEGLRSTQRIASCTSWTPKRNTCWSTTPITTSCCAPSAGPPRVKATKTPALSPGPPT